MKSPFVASACRIAFAFFPVWVTTALGTEPCTTTTMPTLESSYAVGLSVGMFLPTRLPNYQASQLVYGPTFRIPFGRFSLHPNAVYGSGDGVTLIEVDTDLRFTVLTPLFPIFVFAGPHYIHYTFAQQAYDYFGGNVGFGLSAVLSESFILEVAIKEFFSAAVATQAGATVVLRL